jgi:hypothetical protein
MNRLVLGGRLGSAVPLVDNSRRTLQQDPPALSTAAAGFFSHPLCVARPPGRNLIGSESHDDVCKWSILGTVKHNDQVKRALSSLDPTLANLVHDGDSVQFGVRYGKKVEVEYEITSPSGASTRATSNSLTQSLIGASLERSLLPPHQDMTAESASVRGVVKVAMTRYKAWLVEVARPAVIGEGQ